MKILIGALVLTILPLFSMAQTAAPEVVKVQCEGFIGPTQLDWSQVLELHRDANKPWASQTLLGRSKNGSTVTLNVLKASDSVIGNGLIGYFLVLDYKTADGNRMNIQGNNAVVFTTIFPGGSFEDMARFAENAVDVKCKTVP